MGSPTTSLLVLLVVLRRLTTSTDVDCTRLELLQEVLCRARHEQYVRHQNHLINDDTAICVFTNFLGSLFYWANNSILRYLFIDNVDVGLFSKESIFPFVISTAAMWKHPITEVQLSLLKSWGVEVIDPIEKTLICGDTGSLLFSSLSLRS